MSGIENFDEWLEALPDEEIDDFEETVHAEGVKYADSMNDATCRDCMNKFSGDNPREWAEDAVASIAANCKTRSEAKKVVMTVVSSALEVLNVSHR